MSETLTSINSKDAHLLSAYICTYTHTDLLEPNFQKLKSHKSLIKKHLFEIYQSFGIMFCFLLSVFFFHSQEWNSFSFTPGCLWAPIHHLSLNNHSSCFAAIILSGKLS